jgi:hypothetical protein
MTMTAKEALAEVGQVNERLRGLDAMLHRAVCKPTPATIALTQQQIADAMAEKEHLLQLIQAS